MLEIQSWFEGDQDYEGGVLLYAEYGTDEVLKSLFKLPSTTFTRSKLDEALRNIVPEQKPEPKEEPGRTPDIVLKLIRERSQLHEALFTVTAISDRHKIALRILALGKKLDRYYDHGELPNDEAENQEPENGVPVNAWELHMLINNNVAYMAKNKNKPDKAGEVKRRIRQNVIIEERLKQLNYGNGSIS